MKTLIRILNAALVFLAANSVGLPWVRSHWYSTVVLAVCFMLINLFPSLHNRKLSTTRLRICADGCELLIVFLLSTVFSLGYVAYLAVDGFSGLASSWVAWLLVAIAAEAIVFWNGILRVYLTSAQLFLKWRLIGLFCGWVPVANIVVLLKIIGIAGREAAFESNKILVDRARENERICQTKYPLVLCMACFSEISSI